MSTPMSPGSPAVGEHPTEHSRTARLLGILVIVAGAVLLVAGVATWIAVQTQLADENITVAEDSDWFAGEPVDGPFTAYAQAQVIEDHAMEASAGMTYAELPREDPRRDVVMNASFLRASLFTSVVSFGVAAMAMGLGVVVALIGWALVAMSRRNGHPAPAGAGGGGPGTAGHG